MLHIFKNSGTFESDKSYIKCSKCADASRYDFSLIDQLENNSVFQNVFYTVEADTLPEAVQKYIEHIPTKLQCQKFTEIYFQGKLVLSLAPAI